MEIFKCITFEEYHFVYHIKFLTIMEAIISYHLKQIDTPQLKFLNKTLLL